MTCCHDLPSRGAPDVVEQLATAAADGDVVAVAAAHHVDVVAEHDGAEAGAALPRSAGGQLLPVLAVVRLPDVVEELGRLSRSCRQILAAEHVHGAILGHRLEVAACGPRRRAESPPGMPEVAALPHVVPQDAAERVELRGVRRAAAHHVEVAAQLDCLKTGTAGPARGIVAVDLRPRQRRAEAAAGGPRDGDGDEQCEQGERRDERREVAASHGLSLLGRVVAGAPLRYLDDLICFSTQRSPC